MKSDELQSTRVRVNESSPPPSVPSDAADGIGSDTSVERGAFPIGGSSPSPRANLQPNKREDDRMNAAITVDELKELGLDTAASELCRKAELHRRMTIAIEHYRFVTPEILSRFGNELLEKTKKVSVYGLIGGYTHDKLVFTPIKQWGKIPPKEVLDALREAKKLNVFNDFEIAHIEAIEVRPDPILFGTITGCPDKFSIAQWDNDVRIEDILRPDEG